MKWKPIKTVPKNGINIDLWHENGFRETNIWFSVEDNEWIFDNGDGFWLEIPPGFTYWMKVPEPPPGGNISIDILCQSAGF